MRGGKFGPRLTPEQVSEVVARFQGGATLAELADEFGVTTGAISYHLRVRDIRRREQQPEPEPTPTLAELLTSLLPGDWVTAALCAQTDPEAWFVEKGGSTEPAKAICRRCPVRPECLEFALEGDEKFGVWGGMSERERRKLLRRDRARRMGGAA